MDIKYLFSWDVENLDARLNELDVEIGTDWVRRKKIHKVYEALEQAQNPNDIYSPF